MCRCRVTKCCQCYGEGSRGAEGEQVGSGEGPGRDGMASTGRSQLSELQRHGIPRWRGWNGPPSPGLTGPALPLRCAVLGSQGPVGLRKGHSQPRSTPSQALRCPLRPVLLSAPPSFTQTTFWASTGSSFPGGLPTFKLGACLLCHSS